MKYIANIIFIIFLLVGCSYSEEQKNKVSTTYVGSDQFFINEMSERGLKINVSEDLKSPITSTLIIIDKIYIKNINKKNIEQILSNNQKVFIIGITDTKQLGNLLYIPKTGVEEYKEIASNTIPIIELYKENTEIKLRHYLVKFDNENNKYDNLYLNYS